MAGASGKTGFRVVLEVLAIFQWALSGILIVVTLGLSSLYLVLFTSSWQLLFFLLGWLLYDWKTPRRGGRTVPWVRRWCLWRRYCEYFPLKMVKTHDLPPDRNYLLISHPHGLMAHSAFGLFGTEGGDFSRTFPGLKPRLLTLNIFFWIPVLRDYLMSVGICSVCEDSIDYLLSRGKGTMVVVVVGGLAECHYSLPGCSTLVLRNRRGFVRKALQHGVALVPCYSFGENDLYGQRCLRAGSWERRLQDRLRALGHVYPCAFYGSGLSPGSRGLLPFHRTVTAVVGAPLPLPRIQAPSEETVAHYHGLYVAALRRLFDQHKADYGLPDTQELTVV
ncbi:acyl-CoA wax alcohol acyltransferase 2-like [Ornithorhynchus anatinus]|uniref:acyl-CoA wax alcohol acyltransferase 2-like n=1 Tax=Ornithorhynchus anatinus TaxID=9258 RepID=UPI0010A88663|nr:acyl-CoA wax alcohol acyltransferase 2-like [Ornithorhynchus anatinus]